MTKAEYLKNILSAAVNVSYVQSMQKVYDYEIPIYLQKLISCAETASFFDDGTRMLSISEILDASKDLHIDFKGKHIIPVADCGENDFIVYLAKENQWAKFNIVDETVFKKRDAIEKLL